MGAAPYFVIRLFFVFLCGGALPGIGSPQGLCYNDAGAEEAATAAKGVPAMLANEVLSFIEENDVKFIRLAFTDLFGRLRNIAILPDQLAPAMESGVAIDATAVPGCAAAPGGSLLLCPDPDTLCILPWRPQSGRVCRLLCDLVTPQGDSFFMDSRALLRTAARHAKEAGLEVRIGTDCEFYLLNLDDHGRPTLDPYDRGGYMDVAPMDRCEDIRRDIVLTLEQMNIRPESSHHERGPGQNEVDFHRAEPVTAADHYVAFLHAVRSVSQRYGVHATFLPRPLANEEGNGLHVKMAFYQDGRNLFRLENGHLEAMAQSAMAGVLRRLPEITLFLNPLPSSYDRLGAPGAFDRLCWSMERDRSALRIPLPQSRFARMQLSSPDPTMNPYIGFALLIEAALEGIAENASLEPYSVPPDQARRLPSSMDEALALADGSAFVRRILPGDAPECFFARARTLMERNRSDASELALAQLLRY